MKHRNGALGENASNDDGFPESARPRFTQRDQNTCVTQEEADITAGVMHGIPCDREDGEERGQKVI